MKIINKILIYCSGASYKVLDSIDDEIAMSKEKSKYAGLGLSVFLISLLSSISATFFITYAFSTKTPNPINGNIEFSFSNYYLLAGLLWGLIIFSIDRNIIVSIRKTGNLKKELNQAAPRLILAIFIGIIISTPLEMKFFEKEISEKVEEIILNEEKNKNSGDISILREQIKSAKYDYEQTKSERDSAYKRAEKEKNGEGLTGQKGYGNKTKELESKYDSLRMKASSLNSDVLKYQIQLNNAQNSVSLDSLRKKGVIQKYDGAEKRITALHSLSWFHWLITILFIILEITPVLVKLMTKRGIYDEMIDRIDYENELNQKIIISNLNDNINTVLKISTEKNKNKLDAELLANEKLLNEIALAQAEIAKLSVQKWKEQEIEKLNAGINDHVNRVNNNNNNENNSTNQ